jgi:hypothetical protein
MFLVQSRLNETMDTAAAFGLASLKPEQANNASTLIGLNVAPVLQCMWTRTSCVHERHRGHVQDDEEDRPERGIVIGTHPVLVDAGADPLHVCKVNWGVNTASARLLAQVAASWVMNP